MKTGINNYKKSIRQKPCKKLLERKDYKTGFVHGDIKPQNILIGGQGFLLQREIDKDRRPTIIQNLSHPNNEINNQYFGPNEGYHSEEPSSFNIIKNNIKYNTQRVTLIDFGGSQRYLLENEDGVQVHVEREVVNNITCTVAFASLNQMQGYTISRQDDLESLFYTILYLFKVPLKKIVNQQQLHLIKENALNGLEKTHQDIINHFYLKQGIREELFNRLGLPNSVRIFWNYIKNLTFQASPDYSYLISLFEDELILKDCNDAILNPEILEHDEIWTTFNSCFSLLKENQLSEEQVIPFDLDEDINEEIEINEVSDFLPDFSTDEDIESSNSIKDKVIQYHRNTKDSIISK
ncbi:ck1 family protein kinase [Stylonychia lemnae]|uniref:Casein kinase I n=1 Tax=Stylonychia lemnae TaxID=5949 RepID=A0A078AT09_STYLE|nr:ck1 family protein kinase [Stylonychia lemnae]|eukprot:CDW85324.1 ck1 family protein kinase [Stylonychia lemnae]